jgi:hypothetical protein
MAFGLRFRRGQAKVLRALAHQHRGMNEQTADLFQRAANCATRGETITVWCDSIEAAQSMAATFPAYGAAKPTIESISLT